MTSKTLAVALRQDFAEKLTFQSYPPDPEIEGVWMHPLHKIHDENGAFMEYLRLNADGIEGIPTQLVPRQVSVSWAAAGRINAFHVHPREKQTDLWTVLQGSLLVWLVDLRDQSPTCGVRRKLVLSGEAPAVLHVPAGVAHGYRAGQQGAILLYAMDAQFDRDDPNEGRLPWDSFGAEIWQESRG